MRAEGTLRAGRSAIMVLLTVCSAGVAAGELPSMFGDGPASLALGPLAADQELGAAAQVPEDFQTTLHPAATGRSPQRAFLLSLAAPGAGQFYAGSRSRAAVFAGVEALAVGLWYTWNSKGNDIEDEFRATADAHWDAEKYLYWRETSRAIRYNSFTHALPCSTQVRAGDLGDCGSTETQQYYELLGKYDQFVAGWDDLAYVSTGNRVESVADFDSVETVYSELRLAYEDRRDDSNVKLKRATNMTGIILVNHVLSAIDAARTARARSRGVSEAVLQRRTRFLFSLHEGTRGTVPMLYAFKPFD